MGKKSEPIVPNGTKIKFKGSQYGTNQPVGRVMGYDPKTRYYKCHFTTDGGVWKPELLRDEFLLAGGN
jgi:hypothetical protein